MPHVVYHELFRNADVSIDEWTCAEMGYRNASASRDPPPGSKPGVPSSGSVLFTRVFEAGPSSEDEVLLHDNPQHAMIHLTRSARKEEAKSPEAFEAWAKELGNFKSHRVGTNGLWKSPSCPGTRRYFRCWG